MSAAAAIDALHRWLDAAGAVSVAVSGGVDSLTLATLAGRRLGARAAMFHAVSPAVQPEGTARVREAAAREGWALCVVDAGEFARPEYRANPADRCFWCKQSLYAAIAPQARGTIVSGTNTDDLGEYRPGLEAARAAGVRHPYVEAGVDKPGVRAIARALGLGAVAALPASPCLSSRVETGIAIEPATLARIDAAEQSARACMAAAGLPPANVRCRVRAAGVMLELDAAALAAMPEALRAAIGDAVGRVFGVGGDAVPLVAYRTGSAFLVKADGRARHPA